MEIGSSMVSKVFALPACTAICVLFNCGIAFAQPFPGKPIRVLTGGVGGAGDFAARQIAQGLSIGVGQPVIVDNRGGVIPGEIVSKATPDGHVLLVTGSILWITPLMQENVPYDAIRDFTPISLAATSPNILLVHPSLPAKSVKELIALAKARPGDLNYSLTAGGSTHLAGELFKSMTGARIVSIPYKSAAAALNDLLSGQVQLMFATVASATPQIKSGRLKGLAVTSAERTALAPGVPAIAESVPGYESQSIYGVFAPPATTAPLVSRLSQEIVRAMNMPGVKDRLFHAGIETVASTPERLASTVKSEIIRLGKVIKDAGIRAE